MKHKSLITIQRNGKTIVIAVKDNVWSSIPDLSFIEDVEIIDEWPQKKWVNEEEYFGQEFKGSSGYHWINEDGSLNECEYP